MKYIWCIHYFCVGEELVRRERKCTQYNANMRLIQQVRTMLVYWEEKRKRRASERHNENAFTLNANVFRSGIFRFKLMLLKEIH